MSRLQITSRLSTLRATSTFSGPAAPIPPREAPGRPAGLASKVAWRASSSSAAGPSPGGTGSARAAVRGSTRPCSTPSTSVTQQVVSFKVVHPDICADPAFAGKFDETMRTAAGAARAAPRPDPRLGQRPLEPARGPLRHRRAPHRRQPARRARPWPHAVAVADAVASASTCCAASTSSTAPAWSTATCGPSTIVFGDDGVPRLIDVGLGQLLGRGAVGRRRARQQRPGDVRRSGDGRASTASSRRATCTRCA